MTGRQAGRQAGSYGWDPAVSKPTQRGVWSELSQRPLFPCIPLSFFCHLRDSDPKLSVCEALRETACRGSSCREVGIGLCAASSLLGVALGKGPSCGRDPSSFPQGRCLLRYTQVLPAHYPELGRLHHGIEAAAVATTPWRYLCSWGAPALCRIRGHKQGTATVGRVFQMGQGGPSRGHRLL